MASRISFYCAVFLSMLLYDTSEALNCYTQTSCSGAGCHGAVTTDLVDTPCSPGLDVCLRATWEVTENGDKADYTTLGCSVDHGLGNGCFSLDYLPPSIAAAYESLGFDSFEFCLCDQNLCNPGSSTTGSSNTESTNAGSSNAGSSATGSSNTESSNAGSSNTGSSTTGSSNTESSSKGSSNKGSSSTGSITATSTIPVIIGSLLFTLLAFPRQV